MGRTMPLYATTQQIKPAIPSIHNHIRTMDTSTLFKLFVLALAVMVMTTAVISKNGMMLANSSSAGGGLKGSRLLQLKAASQVAGFTNAITTQSITTKVGNGFISVRASANALQRLGTSSSFRRTARPRSPSKMRPSSSATARMSRTEPMA